MDEFGLQQVSLGLESFELGNYQAAIDHFDRVLEVTSEANRIKILKATALIRLGRTQQAKTELEELALIYPDDPELKTLLIDIEDSRQEEQEGNFRSERTRFEKLSPSSPLLAASKGAVFVSADGVQYDSNLLTAFDQQQPGFTDFSDKLSTFPNSSSLAGDWISLCSPWANTFFHWIFEMLPQILISERSGYKGNYLLKDPAPFVLESIELLGLSHTRFRALPEEGAIIERGYLPSARSARELRAFESIYQELRNKLRGQTAPKAGSQRLYVSRNGHHGLTQCWRRVVNESALFDLLKHFSFEKVHFEDHSLKEQLSMSVGASSLVLPHGAGLTHSLFMEENSLIVELFSPTYVHYCYYTPIKLLKHRYYSLPSEVGQFKEYPYGANILAPLDMLELTLRRELAS